MFALANHGVDVLRLDAAPFLWKRMGTDCQNQPEAHLLLQAFRALARLAAPGLVLEAEAIVGPDLLVQYLGGHDRYRPECDLAYDNQLMVMLWSTLATRDVRLAEHALARRRPAPVPTAWVSYLRCHDDIGWAVSDADAASVWLDGPAHRGSSATSTPAASRGPSPGAPCSRRTRSPAMSVSAVPPRRCAASRVPWPAATPRNSPSPSGGWSRCMPSFSPSAASR
jgi:hypothetical protein